MTQFLRVLTALLVVGVTLLAVTLPAGAADAAGDTYLWVAENDGAPHVFTDPASWARQSDGGSGVPGPDAAALVIAPETPVLLNQQVTVRSFVMQDATVDGHHDLFLTDNPAARITAGSAALSGDSYIGGEVVAEDLRLSGDLNLASSTSLRLVAGDDGTSGVVLAGVTSTDLIGLDSASAGVVELAVAGSEPSSVPAVVLQDTTVDVTGEAGGTLAGRLFVSGHLRIVGSVPADTSISDGFFGDDPGSVTWDEEDPAVLDGELLVEPGRSITLPDDLTINRVLGIEGPASGGSVHLGPDGGLHFTAMGVVGSSQQPDLELTGTFSSDPSAEVAILPQPPVCSGDEDLLVRADGGVDQSGVAVAVEQTTATAEGVALGDELVAVYRRESGTTACDAGRTTRVVRAMYRDLLGRRADAGGASYWSGKLDRGTPGATVVANLLATGTARAHLVRSTFAVWACDGEPPSDLAVAMGAEYLRGGGSLPTLRADVLAASVPESGDPVDCLYGAVLGRAPDAAGRAYAERRLASESVQKVAKRLMATSEGRRVQFGRLYERLLDRPATPDEVAEWTRQLELGRTEPWVTAQIVGSAEYAEVVT